MKRSLLLVCFLVCAFGCTQDRDVLVIRDVTVIDGTLPLFIVNGVTAVRDMGSELDTTVEMRDRIENGTLVGPRIMTSGMMVESSTWVAQYVDLMREEGASEAEVEEFLRTRILVGNRQEAKEVVNSLVARGADFIKIRHAESPEVFAALAEAANEAGTHLAGHYLWILSLEESADGGQRSIEHNILPGFDERAPEEKREIFAALLRNNTHFVPALVTNTMETMSLERVRALVEDADGGTSQRHGPAGDFHGARRRFGHDRSRQGCGLGVARGRPAGRRDQHEAHRHRDRERQSV